MQKVAPQHTCGIAPHQYAARDTGPHQGNEHGAFKARGNQPRHNPCVQRGLPCFCFHQMVENTHVSLARRLFDRQILGIVAACLDFSLAQRRVAFLNKPSDVL